jgi:cytochrome c oxidase cbb3-type subunit 1
MSSSATTSVNAPVSPTTAEIDQSCRLPVLLLFGSALGWLVLGALCAFIASLKLHAPAFLAASPWFTYGHVHALHQTLLGYGFAVPAGLGVALWMFARLGRTPLQLPGFAVIGALGWNAGLLLGAFGILSGQSTGFEWLEMPGNSGAILFFSFVFVAVTGWLTFHARQVRELYVSVWFLFAALLWFPWAFSGAEMLLVRWPVNGAAQMAISLWYAHNFTVVWVSLISLAVLFYFLPKLAERPLYSRGLALTTFWGLVFLGGWGGVHAAAPLPKWLSATSTFTNVLAIVPILAFALNFRLTIAGQEERVKATLAGRYFLFAAVAYLCWGLLQAGTTVARVNELSEFTHLATAIRQGGLLAVLGIGAFGAINYIAPKIGGVEWPLAKLLRPQFIAATGGVLMYLGSLAAAGIMQGFALNDPGLAFADSTKRSLMFFRLSTLGDLLFLAAAVMLLVNFLALAGASARACCASCCGETLKTKTAGVGA